jgi:hypothetical protein
MKRNAQFLLLILLTNVAVAKKFPFKLTNNTAFPIQVSAQLMKGVEKDNPDFLFVLKPNESKQFEYKVRNGEKVKFIGVGGGIETLPLVKSFENLSSRIPNEYSLVLPVLDKLNVIELNEAIAKIKNDNILKILMDSSKYLKDELPPLGTFLFIDTKANSVLPLTASYWKNEQLIRNVDNQYFNTTSYINSTNAGSLSVSGVPFLRSLSTSFNSSNIMEVVWDIQNAHIQQWQPNDKNVFQILQDPVNDGFIKACVGEMKAKNLAGGDYQLLFISSAYVVDKIKIAGRKYNAISFNADVDFQIPPTGVEVVQPIGVDASFKYTRAKTYSNVDSTLNAYLRFLAQDYTPALNAYLTQQERKTQKDAAVAKAEGLKNSIIGQYSVLQSLDGSLIKSDAVDVIIPIANSTPELVLRTEITDSANNNITAKSELEYNSRARQYNSVLLSLKENVMNYKLTLESIDKLAQQAQTDYQKVNNLTTTIELEKKIIDAYINKQKEKAAVSKVHF